MTSTPVLGDVVLSRRRWQRLEAAYAERVDRWVLPHQQRRRVGGTHPVVDFLFDYYAHPPGRLRQWHPGAGVALADADEWLERRGYVRTGRGVEADPALLAGRRRGLEHGRDLMARTAARAPRTSCFGLHEWAMVYGRADDRRHDAVPLRLGRHGTDAVVESHPVRCTHFDAFRFFTDDAVPRNERALSRDGQLDDEQPGCVHVTMDLYRLAYRFSPWIGGDLVLDAFELALDARELDMRASPYDLTSLGYDPVPIETPEGKAAYVAGQRDLVARAEPLRTRLLAAYDELLRRLDQPAA